MKLFYLTSILTFVFCLPAAPQATRTVDDIITAYVQALGGQNAIDAVNSRELKGSLGLAENATFYWAKPNKVLRLQGKVKTGFDGSSGWSYNKRKKVHRLGKGDELPLEIDANPLRYAALKQMYNNLKVQPAKTSDANAAKSTGEDMDVLVAPNELGQTTFFFDARTHLLRRIEEKGETSAYFTLTIELLDYKDEGGVKFPFDIVHRSSDKGARGEDFHVKSVKNNVQLDPVIFSKPQATVVISGGKR